MLLYTLNRVQLQKKAVHHNRAFTTTLTFSSVVLFIPDIKLEGKLQRKVQQLKY